MKKTKGKIRKEIKYSTEEWNKVTAPAAYIRDQALNIKIKVIDVFSPDDGVVDIRNKFHREMNEVAKTVNTHKAVFTSDVEEVERIINEMGEFSRNQLHTIAMREVSC